MLTNSHRLTITLSLSCALLLGACGGEIDGAWEELDPAGTLGEAPMADDGPLPEDEASDAVPASEPVELEDSTLYAVTGPLFELPFPCGQVWAGQTRTNHSPVNSVDFNRANDIGDTVVASLGGTVSRVENLGSRSYGRWIEINHGNGYATRYAHLASQTVTRGQHVARGQKIGTVGNTGGSTGPHLHYEQRRNGVALRASFHGKAAFFFGTRNYTSQNGCGAPGGSVVGRINTAGADLNVRAGASSKTAVVGSVADGARVTIRCQKRGESVSGTYGTSTLWDHIGTGYVADAYVSTGSDGQVAPTCP